MVRYSYQMVRSSWWHLFFYHSNGRSYLRPSVGPLTGSSDSASRHRNVETEASFWSATPSICAFEDLGLHEERVLAVGEVVTLLGSRLARGLLGRRRVAS